jgi:hypothetical protein
MTKQEIFNKVWEHFITNKSEPSTAKDYPNYGCMFRKDLIPDNKTRCAVGLFIPDDEYTPDMEINVSTTVHKVASDLAIDSAFLYNLQFAHDSAAALSRDNDKFFELIRSELVDFAINQKLVVPND